MNAIARGWLLGRRARPLFGMRWAQRWTHPLADIRRDLGLELERVDAFLADEGAARLLAVAA
jgi:ubiquinone biosynthesis protein Coq4